MCPQSNVLDTARGNPSSYSRIPSLGAQRKQGGCPAAVRQHGHRGHCVGRSGGQSAASVAGRAQCRSPPLFFSAAALGSVSFSGCNRKLFVFYCHWAQAVAAQVRIRPGQGLLSEACSLCSCCLLLPPYLPDSFSPTTVAKNLYKFLSCL